MLDPAVADQAATLRRLFASGAPRLLPVIVSGSSEDGRARPFGWLASAAARHLGPTLAVDGARLGLASEFDVALRRDLADVIAGEAAPDAAIAPVAQGLAVASATRALERAPRASLERLLAAGGASVERFEWVLAFVGARSCGCLRSAVRAGGRRTEAVVPVDASRRGINAALGAISAARAEADIRVFRLLFLGMDYAAAATLSDRMTVMRPVGGDIELRFGAVLHEEGDADRVAVAAAGWDLTRLDPSRVGADLESVS